MRHLLLAAAFAFAACSYAPHMGISTYVQHEEAPGRFTASWDEPHGAWKVNRGSWVLTQQGAAETLVEYNLELKVSPFPDFVVRAVLLGQLKPVLGAVANQVRRDQLRR